MNRRRPLLERPRVVHELGADGHLHAVPVPPPLQLQHVPPVVDLRRGEWLGPVIVGLPAGLVLGIGLPLAVLVPVLLGLLALGAAVGRRSRDPLPIAMTRPGARSRTT